ncbi:MAG: tRNA preQ1(34) S-adenosylmethionine ribosyltransferase-isomerase QueA [Acidobacteria bacterium]|nr:tRNA preQ1(34) S-adenosylmethionine ribosyltransferase-isomerase QueA [Acidobacteriota bacterium]
MWTSDFDYELPGELIAQAPRPRGTSRLMTLDRASGAVGHRRVADFPGLLEPGEVLLLNDTRVLPARLHARRATGRMFEVFLLRALDESRWEALVRPSAKVRPGEPLYLPDDGSVIPERRLGEGMWRIRCAPPLDLERLDAMGEPPLPPYIHRPDGATEDDRTAYQTVFAERPGAVAAPTAGLHLTREMLEAIAARGVEIAHVTLHVGIGTFRPVTVEHIEDHTMHAEWYEIGRETCRIVNRALAARRRIVCVGTTTVRTLETGLIAGDGVLRPGSGWSRLFITPGFRFLGVGGLLTNFHWPKSTLLMLVSAFAGREHALAAYRDAVRGRYRFFSYGDAMLIR